MRRLSRPTPTTIPHRWIADRTGPGDGHSTVLLSFCTIICVRDSLKLRRSNFSERGIPPVDGGRCRQRTLGARRWHASALTAWAAHCVYSPARAVCSPLFRVAETVLRRWPFVTSRSWLRVSLRQMVLYDQDANPIPCEYGSTTSSATISIGVELALACDGVHSHRLFPSFCKLTRLRGCGIKSGISAEGGRLAPARALTNALRRPAELV